MISKLFKFIVHKYSVGDKEISEKISKLFKFIVHKDLTLNLTKPAEFQNFSSL